MQKYKMTGCARLGLFMILFLPLVYFGVTYFQNGKGWDDIKALFKEEKTSTHISKERFGINDDTELQSTLKMKDQEIKILKERIETLENELLQYRQR